MFQLCSLWFFHICPPLSVDVFLRLALLRAVNVMGVVLDFVPQTTKREDDSWLVPETPKILLHLLGLSYVSVPEPMG